MEASADPAADPAALVSDLIRGAWKAQTARAMAELRLADAMVEPGTAEQVAERTGTHAPTLDRLLRTLAALGLLSYRHGTYALTEAGARLRSDVPGSDWGAMMMLPAPWTLATWHALPEAVRTGEPVFEQVHGESFWEFLTSHEEEARAFNAAMAREAKDRVVADLVVGELKRSGGTTVVDVAGGTGRLLAQVLTELPDTRGILADLAGPVGGSAEVFDAYGVSDRCEAVVCDFFQAVPPGGDYYLLSNILHDWADDRCRDILGRIHEAAAPGARVLVLETVLPDESEGVSPDSAWVRMLDLMMLLDFGARERSLGEYAALLEAAGFGEARLASGVGPHLVVATRG